MTATQLLGRGLHGVAFNILRHRYHTDGRLDMVKVMFDTSKLYELVLAQLKIDRQAETDAGRRGIHTPPQLPNAPHGSRVAGAGDRWDPGPPCSSNSEPGGNDQ